MATRLHDRFLLLVRGSRTALPRHQTLRTLFDWSYNLLTEAEQTLLRRLSVFAGGWTIDSAAFVTAGGLVDLMRHLRASTARRHVREEVPFYTGRRRSPRELVNDLP